MDQNYSNTAYQGYSGYVGRRRRCKADWAGLGLGDAFKAHLDYYQRQPALRIFYQQVSKAQRKAAAALGAVSETDFEPRVKPQLAPCYTNYPAALAALAALGLTAFLEYQARAGSGLLVESADSILGDPPRLSGRDLDPSVLKWVLKTAAVCVQKRLYLQELLRAQSLPPVEIYRLFAAAQQSLRFDSLADLIQGVVLFGDVLPLADNDSLHPMTRQMLRKLMAMTERFPARLAEAPSREYLDLGEAWLVAIVRALGPFLPPPKQEEPSSLINRLLNKGDEDILQRYGPKDGSPKKEPERIPPLNDTRPPALGESRDAGQSILDALAGAESPGGVPHPDSAEAAGLPDDVRKELQDFSRAVGQAGGQGSTWEDMRSDLVERAMGETPFSAGPIEGSPSQGHEVNITLGDGVQSSGEIFDRPLELSENVPEHEALLAEAAEMTRLLRRNFYPNLKEAFETLKLKTAGSLDPARLPLAEVSQAVFKRHRVRRKASKKGKPLLVIACDGSGSLSAGQMRMLKVLTTAWLGSTKGTGVEVLAALFTSDNIRQGLSGPVVKWINHPRKSTSPSRSDSVRALASLPDGGVGAQSDALSLAFIMDEARQLSRGDLIYLILLTDIKWNVSFHQGMTGQQEVMALFDKLYDEDLKNRLHTTMVALGVEGLTGFEERLDKVIPVPSAELSDHRAVASKIGLYVASCMKERNRIVKSGAGE